MEIIFASSNINKTKEIQSALPDGFSIQNLIDLNYFDEIPETANTFSGNALLKAQFVAEKWQKNCFSDDSGLEIEALNNEPGVYSARYAGLQKNDNDNMDLVLKKLENKSNRKASFTTVIALVMNGKTTFFEGKVEGEIRYDKKGSKGFGYDPIFEPEGLGKTFAQMDMEEKSKYSHRQRAVDKMIDYLKSEQI